jgi:hypothetical protein
MRLRAVPKGAALFLLASSSAAQPSAFRPEMLAANPSGLAVVVANVAAGSLVAMGDPL